MKIMHIRPLSGTTTPRPTEAAEAIADAPLSPRIVALEHICAHSALLPASEGLWLIYALRAKMAECETMRADLEAKERAISAINASIDDLRDTLDAVLAATTGRTPTTSREEMVRVLDKPVENLADNSERAEIERLTLSIWGAIERNILYSGQYLGVMICKRLKVEDRIEEITAMINERLESRMDIVAEEVKADLSTRLTAAVTPEPTTERTTT